MSHTKVPEIVALKNIFRRRSEIKLNWLGQFFASDSNQSYQIVTDPKHSIWSKPENLKVLAVIEVRKMIDALRDFLLERYRMHSYVILVQCVNSEEEYFFELVVPVIHDQVIWPIDYIIPEDK